MKLSCWLNQFEQRESKEERLGQRFCNDYIQGPWPELFYEEVDEDAIAIITEYLISMHYYPMMPHKVGDTF